MGVHSIGFRGTFFSDVVEGIDTGPSEQAAAALDPVGPVGSVQRRLV